MILFKPNNVMDGGPAPPGRYESECHCDGCNVVLIRYEFGWHDYLVALSEMGWRWEQDKNSVLTKKHWCPECAKQNAKKLKSVGLG